MQQLLQGPSQAKGGHVPTVKHVTHSSWGQLHARQLWVLAASLIMVLRNGDRQTSQVCLHRWRNGSSCPWWWQMVMLHGLCWMAHASVLALMLAQAGGVSGATAVCQARPAHAFVAGAGVQRRLSQMCQGPGELCVCECRFRGAVSAPIDRHLTGTQLTCVHLLAAAVLLAAGFCVGRKGDVQLWTRTAAVCRQNVPCSYTPNEG
jgi:hypothetical protein